MCGIFIALSRQEFIRPSHELQTLLNNRGPDDQGVLDLEFQSQPGQSDPRKIYLTLCSTVLSLRGDRVVQQPFTCVEAESTSCLSWNGEAWRIAGHRAQGNDTQAVFKLLNSDFATSQITTSLGSSDTEASVQIATKLAMIAGPYSFAYLDGLRKRLFFSRDFLGRRSLMRRVSSDGSVIISSISDGSLEDGWEDWEEVEADGVYCLNLTPVGITTGQESRPLNCWGHFPITRVDYVWKGQDNPDSVVPFLSLATNTPSQPTLLSSYSTSVSRLEKELRLSLQERILNIPSYHKHYDSGDRFTTTKLAILFSGGLDCTVLARLCHDLLPAQEPIDLLNAAFENPRVHKRDNTEMTSSTDLYELCPDRITGRASLAELQAVCPGRTWRFVAINVPYRETLEHRSRVIALISPHNTEMDLSIAYALYFAARGAGITSSDADKDTIIPYTTPAKILLSGLGADELFGGYQRHATAFQRNGLDGLTNELDLDIGRLGRRNLGRDDRVISNWAREARFPFLDESLLAWALHAPVHEKCGFVEHSDGANVKDDGSHLEPGKKVLRCLAWKLGMRKVACEKKRAIQFGARTAKMEARKTKGTNLIS